jgi:putative transposase
LCSSPHVASIARLPRCALAGQPQHIIQQGNNRQVIFASDADYQFFGDAMEDVSN